MPGDYSRRTFDPSQHYSGVLKQQGRVDLDADHNELVEILQHRTNEETNDVIGRCGVPITSNGFKIATASGGNDLTISPGRMYVGGLMCELEDPGTTYTTQPYYPKPVSTVPVTSSVSNPPSSSLRLAFPNALYLAFIDAWQREVTALDNPRIREVALGGPDTTTRLQTVWQMKLLPFGVAITNAERTCETQLAEFDQLTNRTKGLMNARTKPPQNQIDPCLLPATAGYQRLENQLYRVQIHTSGDINTATFGWSRDNASVESTIKSISGNIVIVADIGKDESLGFAAGQWVEIVDEESELNFSPRPLRQIDIVNPNTREITMKSSVAALAGLKNAKLRRWDQTGPSANSAGLRTNLAQWIDLEGGVQVNFSASGRYEAGDYWLIPARTATADIIWPGVEGPNPSPIPQPPVGPQHHYCKLALISVGPTGTTVTADCRPLFPPLTKLTQLHYVSGDGQEGLPGGKVGFPLQVGVANGSFPVENARVRFQIIDGTGNLTGSFGTVTTAGPNIVVRTGADGVAECEWTLDAVTKLQRVQATLVDHKSLPVRFNATFQQAESQRGIHIKAVSLQKRELRNDTNVSPDELIGGISIECDENINPVSISRPTCFVTLEMPFPFNNVDMNYWTDPVVGFQPLILDAVLGVGEKVITWRPTEKTTAFLKVLLDRMGTLKRGDRVLAHLTAKGNFIWAADDPNLYLDGEVFGYQRFDIVPLELTTIPVERGRANAINPSPPPLSPTTDIRLQSGNGWKGGDFEMWFWLKAKFVSTPNISVTPETLVFARGKVPQNLTATVSNIGNAPLTVSKMVIESNPFYQITSSPTAFILAPGSTQPVTVTFFDPSGPFGTSVGSQDGTLKISSDDPDTPIVNVSLVASGGVILLPNIEAIPPNLDFGNVSFRQGNGKTLSLEVHNPGTGLLAVTDIAIDNPVFTVDSPTVPFDVPPGGLVIVVVQFLPPRIGPQSGVLTIKSNDPDTQAVKLSGTGVLK
jgi:hypothetical protein